LGSEQAVLFFVGMGQSHPLNVVSLRFEVGHFIQVHAYPFFTSANKYEAVRKGVFHEAKVFGARPDIRSQTDRNICCLKA
jgi:hypothetical protein